MIKVLSVFGTRPEVIKMAPVIKELKKQEGKIKSLVCISAQHREMIDPLLALFGIKPDYDLDIMTHDQTLEDITVAVLVKVGEIIRKEKPDYVIVQGDTTTSMAASLAAFYQKVKVVHVEAGLRTHNKHHPYPEEVNRVIIDATADIYCAHSEKAKANLLAEGVNKENIAVTGNTVIDALLDISGRDIDINQTDLKDIPFDKKIILVTSHRKENLGEPLQQICAALKELAQNCSDIHIVYPVHLNPNVTNPVHQELKGVTNISLLEPLDYALFVQLMKRSYLILTDSGGLQEEAPSLGKPVLVLRHVTERPEAVEAGAVKVIGTDTQVIVSEVTSLLKDARLYKTMAEVKNPYGDGTAAVKIVEQLLSGNA